MNARIAPPVGDVPAVRHAPRSALAYAALVIFVTMALFGNFLFSGRGAEANGGGGSLVNQIVYLGALTLAVAARKPWKNPAMLLVVPLSLVLSLGWAWLSVTWSLAPAISARRAALLTVVVLTAFLTVRQVGYERTVVILRAFLLVALAASYVAAVLFPSVGIQHMTVLTERNYAGTWRGVFIDKNACGQFCVITGLFFAFGPFRQRRYLLRAAVIVLAVFLLYKTQSKTSLGVLAIALMVGLAAYQKRFFRLFMIPLAAYALVIGILLVGTIPAPFVGALHNSDAFTGRGAIWGSLVRYLQDHWLLGSGYGAFWAIGERSPIFQTASYDWVKSVLTGHNGYLDVWVTLGLPGLLLVVAATLVIPLAKSFSRSIAPRDTALLSSVIVAVAGISVTESILFHTDFTTNIFLMMTIALVNEKTGWRRRPALPAPR